MCIQHGICTCVCIYHSPGKIPIHTDHHLYVRHTYQLQGRVSYQEWLCACVAVLHRNRSPSSTHCNTELEQCSYALNEHIRYSCIHAIWPPPLVEASSVLQLENLMHLKYIMEYSISIQAVTCAIHDAWVVIKTEYMSAVLESRQSMPTHLKGNCWVCFIVWYQLQPVL